MIRRSQFLYPGNVARCQHIKVNGVQCGSPALKSRAYCHFHYECHHAGLTPRRGRRQINDFLFNVPLEDANSIQIALMRVMQLIYTGKLDQKRASLLLYALQTASSNLARTSFEVARPTKVVVDKTTVAETPLGMTPWSERGSEHDIEDEQRQKAEDDAARERFKKLTLDLLELVRPKTEEDQKKREELAKIAGFWGYQGYLIHREKQKEKKRLDACEAEFDERFQEDRWKKEREDVRSEDEANGKKGIDIQACAEFIQ